MHPVQGHTECWCLSQHVITSSQRCLPTKVQVGHGALVYLLSLPLLVILPSSVTVLWHSADRWGENTVRNQWHLFPYRKKAHNEFTDSVVPRLNPDWADDFLWLCWLTFVCRVDQQHAQNSGLFPSVIIASIIYDVQNRQLCGLSQTFQSSWMNIRFPAMHCFLYFLRPWSQCCFIAGWRQTQIRSNKGIKIWSYREVSNCVRCWQTKLNVTRTEGATW